MCINQSLYTSAAMMELFIGHFYWCVCVRVDMKKLNPVISFLMFFRLHPELILVPNG